MSKNSTLLEATVGKYNAVKNLSTSDIAELDKNDVASGNFAWQAGEGMISFIFICYLLCLHLFSLSSFSFKLYSAFSVFCSV